VLALGAAAGVAWLVSAATLAGLAGVLTATMLGATGVLLGRRLVVERRRRRALPEVLRGLRTLNRELRAGAAPLTAVDGAARAGQGAGTRVLTSLAVLMRSGSDDAPAGADPAVAVSAGAVAEVEDRALEVLRSGWLLSRRHGVAFGRVVSGIADELSDEVAAEQARAAQLAGPRMSGYVMAGLPLMGLLLGAGMGVNPAQVLFGSAAGQVLLMVGVALMCAGLFWSARIVGR
jgi:tight adherence protein B